MFNQKRRLDRWVEHLKLHFSSNSHPRPDATPTMATSSVWAVSNEPPDATEVQKVVNRLQLKRATGSDDLLHTLFKNGGSNFVSY